MLSFKGFLTEANDSGSDKSVLWNFLHHLSSSTIDDDGKGFKQSIQEAKSIEDIKKDGIANQPEGNLYHHIKNGFHAAFPEGESPEVTAQKAKEARTHFRTWMAERGGHSAKNTMSLTSDNGKTRSSAGEGVATIGMSLAPHSSSDLHKFDTCPKASAECRKNCLGFTAGGNRQYPEASFRSKLLRTHYIAEHPEHAARLLSHEISEHEDWVNKHHTLHDSEGNIVGHKNIETGKVTSASPKSLSHEDLAKGVESGKYSAKKIKSGVRLNVTSDLPYESLMPHKFFQKHSGTQFYDYTKVAGRLKKKLPSNYSLALSHTGTGHAESNDKAVVDHLNNGGVVAMVHQKSKVTPTHVEDVQSGKRWRITNGDNDDNVFDRHAANNIPKSEGVVSGLKLKGVKNEAAGHFANKVDPDGIIRINKPK